MAELIAVSGCGRCGSTMVMSMLAAAGVPVVCDSSASFECELVAAAYTHGDGSFLREHAGKAIKVLDPHRLRLPDVPIAWIWMRRHPLETAKSQAKLLGIKWAGGANGSWAKSIERDNERVPGRLARKAMYRVLIVQYEEVLVRPRLLAEDIAFFLGVPTDKASVMAAAVHPRGPRCLPDLSVEHAAVAAEVARG